MNREAFIKIMNGKIKLIRTEYGLTQDKMALILGISKKTLIEIEKNRKSLGWTASVALASIFSDSSILQDAMGGELSDIIIAVAFKDVDVNYPQTMGGKIWWKVILDKDGYRIQQNVFSRHYRLLDQKNRRIYASFSLDETKAIMEDCLRTIRN
ncbi:MAG TPA: helix-turn-helix domain-containing protein [Desulfitobacteriaceae bacterium]|jgi:DNA-binding XRE family transcriptional regulator|nr:helix-turn-helix domain-containing protein [Desulfitobacteriaceae bacterium]